jgi:2'-5' RNA ligase
VSPEASPADAPLRVFFALWPSAEVREAMARLAATRDAGPRASPVPAENYHATIAFVGSVPAARLPALRRIGAETRMARFALRFEALEYWPKPEVVVAAVRTIPAALQALWDDLHARLAAHDFELAPKRLRPHVTLARKVTQAPVPTVMSPLHWEASDFSLVRSLVGGAHSAYTVVETWPLLDER